MQFTAILLAVLGEIGGQTSTCLNICLHSLKNTFNGETRNQIAIELQNDL